MTGLHDEPAAKEPRRSKRLQRSMPEAATPPPACRTRRTKRPAPPREGEPSVPAARAARSSSPCRGDRDLVDVVALPPPPAPRAEAPVPPPEREDSPDLPRTAYVLRNRRVPDAGIHKPAPPPCYERRGMSMSWLKQWASKAFPTVVRGCMQIFLLGCDDLVPKYFFAELKIDAKGLSCVSCFKFDSVDWKNFGGCGVCPATFVHPAGGGYIGAWLNDVFSLPPLVYRYRLVSECLSVKICVCAW